MNSLIQSHNQKIARLAAVCSARRSIELDFFTEASNNYKSYIMGNVAFNPYENPSLTEMVKQDFISEAQNPESGIIRLQTRLNIEKKSLPPTEMKQYQKQIDQYFKRLDQIIELGGYLTAAIEPLFPDNLPIFIANYNNININGINERTRDRNMFMLAGWADLFNYFKDVDVEKSYYFTPSVNGEIVVFSQKILFKIGGETFRKYLHKKPYVIDDFMRDKNIERRDDGNYYVISMEINSNQLKNSDILDVYLSDVPENMNLMEIFDNGGITQNGTLQPQYFLGGSIMEGDDNVEQDTSIKIPMYKVADGKVKRYMVKPVDTEAINNTPAYNAEVTAHIAGLFARAGGNISVLYGYSNKRLGLDLPIGINEAVSPELEMLYNSLSPEGKAGYVGNRYMFNKAGTSGKYLSLIDAQKAYIMEIILQSNLDRKIPQKNYANQPSIVKEQLEDSTPQGRDLIEALNKYELAIPEQPDEQLQALIQQYS